MVMGEMSEEMMLEIVIDKHLITVYSRSIRDLQQTNNSCPRATMKLLINILSMVFCRLSWPSFIDIPLLLSIIDIWFRGKDLFYPQNIKFKEVLANN